MISTDTFSLTDAERTRFAQVQRLGANGEQNISELLGMLTDPSWMVRRFVVESIARVGEAALPALIELLRFGRDSEARIAAVVDTLCASQGAADLAVAALANDPDPAIVADVAQILGRRRSPSSVPTLVHLTKNPNDNVVVGAIEALGRIGGRAAVEALIEIVQSRNFFKVFPAIDVLGRSGDPRAVSPLIKLLADPLFLPEAARALGRTGDRSAISPLVELLNSTGDSAVRIAAQALADLRERYQEKSGGHELAIDGLVRSLVKKEMVRRLSRVLPQSDNSEAAAICQLLGVIGDAEATPVLTKALDRDGIIAKTAAAALKKMGRDAEAVLIEAITTGSSDRRKILLPLVTRTSAAGEIAVCLLDPDSEVRSLACDTLARLGNASVVAQIFPLLADSNLQVVHSATAALQSLGSRETRDLALAASDSKNAIVRRSALRILSYFGDQSALPPLLKGLNDADPRVREAAIHGLPYVDAVDALEALYITTQHENPRTRALAMRALGQLSEPNNKVFSLLTTGLSDIDPWTRYYACQSLGRLKFSASAEHVSRLLDDDAGQVRVAAVEALSHFDSPSAHEALRNAAQRPDIDVRRAALVGLGIARRENDLPILLAATASLDPSTRLMAISAIAGFPSERALNALRTAASDSDEQVSSSAMSFLGVRREQEATEFLVELLAVPAVAEKAEAALLVPNAGRAAGLLVSLESADHELAAKLVSILSRLERAEAQKHLLAAIRLNNVAARKAAAPVLAARRNPEMDAALQEAAENDPDPEVRQISSLLLRQ